MRATFAALLLAGCVTTPAPVPVKPVVVPPTEPVVVASDPQAPLRALVEAFVSAAEARRFDEVLALMSKPLRERYSVETLKRDFGADPQASERLAQIKLKAAAPLIETKQSASLEWSAGRSLRMVHEAEGWRIAALE